MRFGRIATDLPSGLIGREKSWPIVCVGGEGGVLLFLDRAARPIWNRAPMHEDEYFAMVDLNVGSGDERTLLVACANDETPKAFLVVCLDVRLN